MALGTCSVCLTVLVLNLHHRHTDNRVPKWAKWLILRHLSRILCMKPRRPLRPKNMLDCGEISIRDGIRRIAQDMQVMNPMLTSNGRESSGYPGTTNNTVNSGDPPRYRQVQYSSNHKRAAGPTRSTNTFRPPPSRAPDPEESLEYVNEWRELAHVLDRLFFWIVFLFMTISTLYIILTPIFQTTKIAPFPVDVENKNDTE